MMPTINFDPRYGPPEDNYRHANGGTVPNVRVYATFYRDTSFVGRDVEDILSSFALGEDIYIDPDCGYRDVVSGYIRRTTETSTWSNADVQGNLYKRRPTRKYHGYEDIPALKLGDNVYAVARIPRHTYTEHGTASFIAVRIQAEEKNYNDPYNGTVIIPLTEQDKLIGQVPARVSDGKRPERI